MIDLHSIIGSTDTPKMFFIFIFFARGCLLIVDCCLGDTHFLNIFNNSLQKDLNLIFETLFSFTVPNLLDSRAELS